MNIADELQKLQQLHQSGAISDEEYAAAKAKLLDSPPGGPVLPAAPVHGTTDATMGHAVAHLSVGRISWCPWPG